MTWTDRSTDNCSIGRTLAVVGDRWSLLVLREVFNGVRRFDELHAQLGAARTVLTQRLDRLVGEGILERRPYREPGQRVRHEYRLTAKGRDLYWVLVALLQFGDTHLADAAGPALRIEHRDCGEPVRVQLVCAAGHEVASPRQAVAVPGPGARPRAAS